MGKWSGGGRGVGWCCAVLCCVLDAGRWGAERRRGVSGAVDGVGSSERWVVSQGTAGYGGIQWGTVGWGIMGGSTSVGCGCGLVGWLVGWWVDSTTSDSR
jgi:hypothetical protein